MPRINDNQINYAEQWGTLYPNDERIWGKGGIMERVTAEKRQRQLESEQFRASNPVETSTMENTGLGLFGLGMAASAFPPTAPLGAGLIGAGMVSELTGNPLSQLYQSYRGLTPRETTWGEKALNTAMVVGLPFLGAIPKIGGALASAAGIGLGGYGLYEKGQGPGTFGENLTEAMLTQPVPTAVDAMALSHGAGSAGEAMGKRFLPGIIKGLEPTPGAAQDAIPMDVKRSLGIFRYLPEAVMPPEVTRAKGLYDVGVDFAAPRKFIGDEAVAKAAEAKITGEYGVNISDQIKGASSEIWLNEGQIKKAWSESKPINIMNPAAEGEAATVAIRIDPKDYKTLGEFRRFFVEHEYNHNMGILGELQASTTPRTQAEMDATQKLVKKITDLPEHVQKTLFEARKEGDTSDPLAFLQNDKTADQLRQMGSSFGSDFIRSLRAERDASEVKQRPEAVPEKPPYKPLPIEPITAEQGRGLVDEKFVDPYEPKSDVYNDESGNMVVRSRDTSEPSRFFAKGKQAEDDANYSAWMKMLGFGKPIVEHKGLKNNPAGTKNLVPGELSSETQSRRFVENYTNEMTRAEAEHRSDIRDSLPFSGIESNEELLGVLRREQGLLSETSAWRANHKAVADQWEREIEAARKQGPRALERLRFAKGKAEEEPGFLGKIVSLPGTWKEKLEQGGKAISDWAQRLVGKNNENMLIGLEKHAHGLGVKVVDGKLPMEHVNDLKKEMYKGIANEAQLKKEFGKIINLAAQVDVQAEPDFINNGGFWLRGMKGYEAKTPEGLALQKEILAATKRLGKEEYRYLGDGDYARQMLVTKNMDTLVLDALEGLGPEAQKGFLTMFKPESKLSEVEKTFRNEYLKDVRGDPARENQLLKVREYFKEMNNKAITALSDPQIIGNDPNALEFAGMNEKQLRGRLGYQTAELVKSIWLKQMEPGNRLNLEKEFRPSIEQKRSFFFSPEYLEKDGRRLLQSWMSQHQMLQKAPVYNKITKMLTEGIGKGMPGAREVLKNIQQETNAQVIRGKPNWVSTTADKFFGWQTSDAINPGTEVVMKIMQTMYQQFLGTPRFAVLNSSDAFLKAAMLLSEKGNGIEDMAAVGKIIGKSIIGDKGLTKIIDDFFVSGEPASYELKRVFDLPAKGDPGIIPEMMQKIPFLYEKGYRGIRKAQTEIIKRSENFSDKVAFLSNLELELRRQGKTLDDIYKIPEEARQELVGRVIDDTMKLQNKYAGVLNKSNTGYKVGAYGSPEYIAMNLAGMFAKYPINFLNELAKRQAANGKYMTGPFMAFVLAAGGTFGPYSLLTSKEQKDTMGKARTLAFAWTRSLTQIKPGSVPLGLVEDALGALQGDPSGLRGVLSPIIPGMPAARQGYNALNL